MTAAQFVARRAADVVQTALADPLWGVYQRGKEGAEWLFGERKPKPPTRPIPMKEGLAPAPIDKPRKPGMEEPGQAPPESAPDVKRLFEAAGRTILRTVGVEPVEGEVLDRPFESPVVSTLDRVGEIVLVAEVRAARGEPQVGRVDERPAELGEHLAEAAQEPPIFDEFDRCGVRFALEVLPTGIAFDLYTSERLLRTFDGRPTLGFNFDPSHLRWQGLEPHLSIREFPSRIYHVHMKDVGVTLDGRAGILGSHLPFGDLRRGWNFRSLGHGDVNFEDIVRALGAAGYTGPLSVEWEDNGMDREVGAREPLDFVRRMNFAPSNVAFDKDMRG